MGARLHQGLDLAPIHGQRDRRHGANTCSRARVTAVVAIRRSTGSRSPTDCAHRRRYRFGRGGGFSPACHLLRQRGEGLRAFRAARREKYARRRIADRTPRLRLLPRTRRSCGRTCRSHSDPRAKAWAPRSDSMISSACKHRGEGAADEMLDQDRARLRPANVELRRRAPPAQAASPPPDRHGRDCRRSCRGCGWSDKRSPPATAAQHLAAGELAARILEAGVGDAGADPPSAAEVLDLPQRVEPRHVDQQRRPREPQIQHRPERLPAGEELGAFGLASRRPRPRRRRRRARSRSARPSCGVRPRRRSAAWRGRSPRAVGAGSAASRSAPRRADAAHR